MASGVTHSSPFSNRSTLQLSMPESAMPLRSTCSKLLACATTLAGAGMATPSWLLGARTPRARTHVFTVGGGGWQYMQQCMVQDGSAHSSDESSEADFFADEEKQSGEDKEDDSDLSGD